MSWSVAIDTLLVVTNKTIKKLLSAGCLKLLCGGTKIRMVDRIPMRTKKEEDAHIEISS